VGIAATPFWPRGDEPRCARSIPASSSSPRSTGTSIGRSSSRVRLHATTKRLYDRLEQRRGAPVRGAPATPRPSSRIASRASYREPRRAKRAAATFTPEVHRLPCRDHVPDARPAASSHQGQREGRPARPDPYGTLGRGTPPRRPTMKSPAFLSTGLLACLDHPSYTRRPSGSFSRAPIGRWAGATRRMTRPSPGPGGPGPGAGRRVVVVTNGPQRVSVLRVGSPGGTSRGRSWRFRDEQGVGGGRRLRSHGRRPRRAGGCISTFRAGGGTMPFAVDACLLPVAGAVTDSHSDGHRTQPPSPSPSRCAAPRTPRGRRRRGERTAEGHRLRVGRRCDMGLAGHSRTKPRGQASAARERHEQCDLQRERDEPRCLIPDDLSPATLRPADRRATPPPGAYWFIQFRVLRRGPWRHRSC
jgi:hypothetical protein